MARKLVWLTLGVAAAAYVLSLRKSAVRIGIPARNGGSSHRSESLRRLIREARRRVQAAG